MFFNQCESVSFESFAQKGEMSNANDYIRKFCSILSVLSEALFTACLYFNGFINQLGKYFNRFYGLALELDPS